MKLKKNELLKNSGANAGASPSLLITFKILLGSTIGRLPGPMVIIFAASLSVALLLGLGLKIASDHTPKSKYLLQRLEPQANAPQANQAELLGNWVFKQKVDEGKNEVVMSLEFKGNDFQWIFANSNAPYNRYFIRGSYKLVGNVMVMSRRGDMGSPITPGRLELDYLPADMETLNFYVLIRNGAMVWEIPADEMAPQTAFFRNLLPLSSQNTMTWAKVQ